MIMIMKMMTTTTTTMTITMMIMMIMTTIKRPNINHVYSPCCQSTYRENIDIYKQNKKYHILQKYQTKMEQYSKQ